MTKSRLINEVPADILMAAIKEHGDGVAIMIQVKPNASVEKLSVGTSLAICLSVKARALENQANIRVKELIAELFSVPPSKVTIMSGQTSSRKRIFIRDVSRSDLSWA